MAGNRRKAEAEWRIEERDGKRLKLVLIRKAVPASGEVDEAVGTAATTSRYKGHTRIMKFRPNAAEPLPASLRRQDLLGTLLRMRANRPTCVFQKRLTKSDIDGWQNRLQLGREEVRKSALYGLLTPEERAAVEGGAGVKVRVLDQVGREHALTFLFYPRSLKQYRFIGPDYGKIVRENGWEAGQTLHLWGFRLGGNGGADRHGELVVAMLNEGEEEEEEEAEQETQLGSQVGDHDRHSYCSDITPDDMEVAEILLQLSVSVNGRCPNLVSSFS